MPGAIGLALLAFGIAALVWTHGEREILGLAPEDFARLTALTALVLFISGSLFSRYRGRFAAFVGHLVSWVVIFVSIIALYTHRFELESVAMRVMAELRPGSAVTIAPGEVSVRRGFDGSFVLRGSAEGTPLDFIFDTGANVVVLTAEAAERLGYAGEDLSYRVPVLTANGRTMAAPIVLDTLAVGDIVERRVRALVARPGALPQNLLGMTFLDRLESYEVRRDELVLRGRG
ncbi:retropepsin-like aspartic protease family protein [Salinarimonas ramus]|uniref:Aspartic protease n=1 Tax=Salinarimonas ramus TaxID=690164 RepID=A0A917Q515_9HYPH|nr:TIGR02281 family clan AA aspartic protease [Salinarimonas ramus]GGK23589.1 aspartic protease [Salinarimonas ramus]